MVARRVRRAATLALTSALALAACSGEPAPEAVATEVPKAVAGKTAAGPVVESEYGTPVKDRVATIGLLNKRNNLGQDVLLKTGEAKRIGNVVIKLATCERTLPWERPPETGAFVQVFVEERANADSALAWRKVFSGWLFKNSPSLNVVEHPVYDVWVKDCAMKFPGEEASPAPAASPTSAAKPSGNAKAAPSPSPAPEPKAAPAPAPSPSVDL
jgi:hypothetical protein